MPNLIKTDAKATDATATDAKATDAKAAKAAQAKAKRDAAKAAKAEKPATVETPAATISRGLARDAATVTAQRTNFAQYSDRDTAFLAFFGRVMRANNGSATLAQIHESGTDAGGNKRRNPLYAGSAKATDAGAINRLIKAGYLTANASGGTLTATPKALSNAAYNGKA